MEFDESQRKKLEDSRTESGCVHRVAPSFFACARLASSNKNQDR